MTGRHLGPRVGALVDGQLPAAEAERAWQHVHACRVCRDAVEREGWIKRQLACLAHQPLPLASVDLNAIDPARQGESAPRRLVGDYALACAEPVTTPSPGRRMAGVAFVGAGAAGAAMMGALVLSVLPGDLPGERRAPTTSLVGSTRPTQTARASAAPQTQQVALVNATSVGTTSVVCARTALRVGAERVAGASSAWRKMAP